MRLVRHRGKWAVRIEGRRLSTGYDCEPEHREAAERQARKIIAELRAPVKTIMEIMEAYAKEREGESRDGSRVRHSVKALKPVFDGIGPDQVTRELCRSFADRRRKAGISDGTIIRDLKIMCAACNWHDKRNAGQYWYPPEPEPRDRVLSKTELASLIEASPFHLRVFIHLAYGTAARAGAIYELTWLQVDWDGNCIRLGRKANGKRRATVPMTETLKAVLLEAKEIAESSHVVEYAGEPVKSVKRAFATACDAAKIEDFHIHDIRHTAAVHQIEAGAPMEMISQFLGHSNIAITAKVYARYRPEAMRQAADALEL